MKHENKALRYFFLFLTLLALPLVILNSVEARPIKRNIDQKKPTPSPSPTSKPKNQVKPTPTPSPTAKPVKPTPSPIPTVVPTQPIKETPPATPVQPLKNTDMNPDTAVRRVYEATSGAIQVIEGNKLGVAPGFSFRFDKKGTPSLAFYDLDDRELMYAKVEKGRWVISRVAQAADSGEGLVCSLTFDKNNNPMIAYVSPDKTLNLAKLTNREWVIETVDNTKNTGFYCSLALNGSDDPLIAYQGPENFFYARKALGNWIIEKVDVRGEQSVVKPGTGDEITLYYTKYENPGKKSSLKLKKAIREGGTWKSTDIPKTESCLSFDVGEDSCGKPFIVFTGGKGVHFLSETIPDSGIWKEETVSAESTSLLSLAYTPTGSISVCYICGDGKKLEIAQRVKEKWVVDSVATARTGYTFQNQTVALGPGNRQIVLLHDGDSLCALVQDQKGWKLGRIAGKIRVGGYVSTTSDHRGQPMVAYYDYTRQDLHFAQRIDNTMWRLETVDSLGDVGRYASIAADSSGNPGIAYYDRTRADLKYAWKESGTWKWERADFNGDTGLFASLAFAAGNVPCIAYYNETQQRIEMVSRRNNKWVKESIAPAGNSCTDVKIAMNSSGKPVVVFTTGEKKGNTLSNLKINAAEQVGAGQWKVTTLVGQDKLSGGRTGLSLSSSPSGEIACTFIDKLGQLYVLRNTGGTWKSEIIDSGCWDSTSIRYNSDGTLAVLYIKGDSRTDNLPVFARFDGSKWNSAAVKFPVKSLEFVSLADSPTGTIRFAYGDSQYFFAGFFEKNEK